MDRTDVKKKSDLKDIVRNYDDSPRENDAKLKAEEEKSAKLKDWVLE